MKKLSHAIVLLLGVVVLFNHGCSDGAIGDDFADTHYVPRGTLISAASVDGCILTDVAASVLTLDLVSQGEAAASADIYAAYNGGAEVLLGTVTDVPSADSGNSIEYQLSFADLLTASGVAEGDVEVGDVVSIAFEGKTASGETFRSSAPENFNVGCPSNLGGTYDYVSTNLVAITNSCPTGEVTGTVTFTDLGCGVYQTSDLGFGQYESSCWSDGPATSAGAVFSDICGELITGGTDQYGLVYIWEVTDVSGPNLSMSWSNDYGDSGDVVITRGDGSDWPDLFTN